MSWLMHGPQSLEIGVVCLIWVQKCIDLAHSIRLELELLRHWLFVTEWRSWLLCIMENLIMGKTGEGVFPKDWLHKLNGRPGSLVPVISCRQDWSLFLLEWMFHNAAAMWHKKHQRHTWGLPLEPTETAPEHPSVWTLIGSQDSNLLWVMDQIYKGEYALAPSVLTCTQQEDFMKELWWKLSECMTRAVLWSERMPAELPSRNQRHSEGPVEEDHACEVEWQNGWSKLRKRWTHSRGQSGLRQCQSPSPSCPSQHQSPSPSPPLFCPADERLHYSMENLKLQPRSQESKSRTRWCDASPQREEKPRKQVQFEVDEELGNEPNLPSDSTLFLAEVQPQSEVTLPVYLLSCPPTKSPQHSCALTGGAWPKVLAVMPHGQSHSQSQMRPEEERPDPVNYPHWWIADEMSWSSNPNPHWWREIKACGGTSLGAHIVFMGHNDPAAQHFALQQVATFRLPVAKQEASWWWDAPPTLHGLHSQDFLPALSNPQNF